MKRLAICAIAFCFALAPFSQADAQGRRPRKLAPGVMKEIPPAPEYKDSVARHDVVELLAVEPE